MNRVYKVIILAVTLLVTSSSVFAQQYSYDYDNMKMDEYFAELSKWQKRLADAQAGIAEQEAMIAKLNGDMTALDAEYDKTWNEIYTMLGTDKAGYDAFVAQCKALESDVQSFGALSAEDIVNRMNELDGYEARLAEMRKDKRSIGPDPFSILNNVEALIQEARRKSETAAAKRYSVMRGDYLWKIAKNPANYGDPYAWMRIYSANRDQIKNPDLIYPNQVFMLPRFAKRGTHWVNRGESLTDIAKRYGSPFTWQRIYEANKDVIGEDANMIYPHMILSVPGN